MGKKLGASGYNGRIVDDSGGEDGRVRERGGGVQAREFGCVDETGDATGENA